jgi:hypothetical protein
MARDDTGTAIILIILAALLYLMFYHPAASDVLWGNDCSSVDGWVTMGTRKGVFESFSETYGVAPYCIRSYTYCGDHHYMDEMGYIVNRIPIIPQIQANASLGIYSFVLGARLKIKSIATWIESNGGISFTVLDASGNGIGGFMIMDSMGNQPYIYSLKGNNKRVYLSYDDWIDFEIFIHPSGSKLYIDGQKVAEDTVNRLNVPPAFLQVSNYSVDYNSSTEVLIDQIYIKKATDWYWGPPA